MSGVSLATAPPEETTCYDVHKCKCQIEKIRNSMKITSWDVGKESKESRGKSCETRILQDNTRMKEIFAELKKNADAVSEELEGANRAQMERIEAIQEQIERLEGAHRAQMERIEAIQVSNESQFIQLNVVMSQIMQRLQINPSSSHGSGNSYKDSSRNAFQVRSVKLDFPRFDGMNVLDWIFRAEQFFDYYSTPDAERLLIASVHLDHEVVPWFQMIQKTEPLLSWHTLTRALEMDFGSSAYDCPRSNLFKLVQTTTVNDFYMRFTALVNRVDGLSTNAVLDYFISGLQDDIQRDVKAMEPRSLSKAFALAKLYEEKYVTNKPKSFTTQTAKQRRTEAPSTVGMMGSLRVIELQLVAFILFFSASGLVPLINLFFPALASAYILALAPFAFPSTLSSHSQSQQEIFKGSRMFRMYVIVGTTIGLFLPLAYVLGGYARGDEHAVRSATLHLFLLSCQILTENVISGLSLFSPPVRALVPMIYTIRRIFVDIDWINDVWINKTLPANARFQDTTWYWFGKGLAVANLAYFSTNLCAFLIPRFLPRAFERYFQDKGEIYAKTAEDKRSMSLNKSQSSEKKLD